MQGDGLNLSSPKCVLCEVISFREYSLVKEENEQLYSEENWQTPHSGPGIRQGQKELAERSEQSPSCVFMSL